MPTPSSAHIRRIIALVLTACAALVINLTAVSPAIAGTRSTRTSQAVTVSRVKAHGKAAKRSAHKRAAKAAAHRRAATKKKHRARRKASTKRTTVKKPTVKKPTVKKATTPPATTPPVITPPTTTPPTTTLPGTSTVTGVDPLTTIGLPSGSVTSADPSGAPMPTGNLPGWNQVFADDFTTNVPLGSFSGCNSNPCTGLPASVGSQVWAYPDGWKDTSGNGTYEPSQVLSIHNGMLDYYLHDSMVSAVVPNIPGATGSEGGLQYGAYAVRFRADDIPGYKTAFLLWPDSEVWPEDGEIDFPEGDLDSTFSAFMHPMGATSGSQQDAYSTDATYPTWHTAVIEWTPTLCRFILDGQVIGTSVNDVPNDPMHWVLQVETALDQPAPASDISGHVDIDWMAVYTPATV